jgi:hypothetical protein
MFKCTYGLRFVPYLRRMDDSGVVAVGAGVAAVFVGAMFFKSRPSTDPRCVAFAARFGIHDLVGREGYLAGTLRGLAVEMNFRPYRKQSPSRTVITVAGVPATILLHLRRQTDVESEQVRQGKAIDLVLGDPAFDAAWIVEGAPADRVERVLRHPWFLQRFMALASRERGSVLVEDGKVTITCSGNDFEGPAIDPERFELAVALAEAVALDAAAPLPNSAEALAATYRTAARLGPDTAGLARSAELKVLRGTRAIAELRPVGIAFPAILSVLLLALCFVPGTPLFVLLPASFAVAVPATAFVVGTSVSVTRKAPGTRLDKPVLVSQALAWLVNFGLLVWVLRGGGR